MSSSEPPEQGPGHRRLAVWLVAAHLVAGLVLGGFTRWIASASQPEYAVFALAGLVFAQASLVGMWAALDRSPAVVRLIGFAVGVSYLGPMFGFCIHELDIELVMMVATTAACVAALLLVPRHLGFELAVGATGESIECRKQFSIRQLMLLTAAVACLLAIRRWLWPLLDVDIVVVAAPFAAIGIASPWSLLGTKRLLPGIIVPFGLAFAVAYGLASLAGRPPELDVWAAATLTEASTLVLTLGVLRSRGFRLYRQRRPASP